MAEDKVATPIEESPSTAVAEDTTTKQPEQPSKEQPVQPAKPDDTQDLNDLTEVDKAGAIRQIINLSNNPAIANMPQVQDLIKSAEKVTTKGTAPEQAVKPTDVPVTPTAGNTELDKEVDALANTITADPPQTQQEDDPFGLSAAPAQTFDIKDEDGLKKIMKDRYSIDDYNTLINSVDIWRTDATKHASLETKWNELVQGLSSMPDPIKAAVDTWSNAGDWNAAFQTAGGGLDYSKDFTQQNKNDVLNKYFSDKMTDLSGKLKAEEIEQPEYDSLLSTYADSAQKLYDTDKQNFERQRTDLQKQQEEAQEALQSSAISSVGKLKETYRNFNGSELQSIQARLVNGDISSIFYDKKGNYREDAAERMALAVHGKNLITRLTAKAAKEGESTATEEIVSRASDKPKDKKKASGAEEQTVGSAIQHLNSEFIEDPYANAAQVAPQNGQA